MKWEYQPGLYGTINMEFTLWLFNSSPWKIHPFLRTSKPSISMGHLYHGKLLVITRGYMNLSSGKHGWRGNQLWHEKMDKSSSLPIPSPLLLNVPQIVRARVHFKLGVIFVLKMVKNTGIYSVL